STVNAFYQWEEIDGAGGWWHYDSGACGGKQVLRFPPINCDTCESGCLGLEGTLGINCARCQNYAESPDTYDCTCYAPEN
ncbi:hypothetical protein MKW92_050061, partial [Papaver armeniacum]